MLNVFFCYLFLGPQNEHDEQARSALIEEFFRQSMQPQISHSINSVPNYSGNAVPPLEGPLYLKSESKKGWKRYNFVMRSSGQYHNDEDFCANILVPLIC